jgi:hypothetical protein
MDSNHVLGAFEKVELTEAELTEVVGGVGDLVDATVCPSSGWICSISAECNGGRSCNPFPW